jgi:hypothetical protein
MLPELWRPWRLPPLPPGAKLRRFAPLEARAGSLDPRDAASGDFAEVLPFGDAARLSRWPKEISLYDAPRCARYSGDALRLKHQATITGSFKDTGMTTCVTCRSPGARTVLRQHREHIRKPRRIRRALGLQCARFFATRRLLPRSWRKVWTTGQSRD